MFRIANCSPTGKARCRDFQMNSFIFSAVLIFHTFANQSHDSVGIAGSEVSFSSISVKYPDRVEYSPDVFFSHTNSSGTHSLLGFIFRICSLWKGTNCSNLTTSHSVEFGRNRSETFRER